MVLLWVSPMAFVWRHPTSKYWMARFYDREGKRRNRSTKIEARGEKSRKAAQSIADEYEGAAKRKRTAFQMRKVISELHQEITGEDLPTLSVKKHVEGWLTAKKPETAPTTYAFYDKATSRFLDFMAERANEDIAAITRTDIVAFRNLLAETLSGTTVNHNLKALRSVFKSAERDHLLDENPTTHVDFVKKAGGRPARRAFTVDELKSVLTVANDEWRSMTLFGLYTGQRLKDLATLTWQQIDLEAEEIRLTTGKTGRHMILPIPTPLHEHLMSIASSDDPTAPLHPTAFTISSGKHSGALSNQFNDLLASIGLRKKRNHTSMGKGRSAKREASVLSFHSLRATATTFMHEAGVPAAVVQELIGHDSAEVHRTYVKIGREALKGAADKLPDLVGKTVRQNGSA